MENKSKTGIMVALFSLTIALGTYISTVRFPFELVKHYKGSTTLSNLQSYTV